MGYRSVKAVHAAARDDIGDLMTRRLPLGPHPHCGFETVTFILEGNPAHHDSAGWSN